MARLGFFHFECVKINFYRHGYQRWRAFVSWKFHYWYVHIKRKNERKKEKIIKDWQELTTRFSSREFIRNTYNFALRVLFRESECCRIRDWLKVISNVKYIFIKIIIIMEKERRTTAHVVDLIWFTSTFTFFSVEFFRRNQHIIYTFIRMLKNKIIE